MHIFRESQKEPVIERFLQKYYRCSDTWPPRASLILLVIFSFLDVLKAENGIKKRCFIITVKMTFLVTLGNSEKKKITKKAAKIIKDTIYIEMPC